MKTTILATGLAIALGISSAYAQTSTTPGTSGAPSTGQQMSSAQCDSLWQRADASNAGSLSPAQATAYVRDFSGVDTNKDGKLSQAEWSAACQRGMVHDSATTGGGSGTSGGNSPGTTPGSSPSGSSVKK